MADQKLEKQAVSRRQFVTAGSVALPLIAARIARALQPRQEVLSIIYPDGAPWENLQTADAAEASGESLTSRLRKRRATPERELNNAQDVPEDTALDRRTKPAARQGQFARLKRRLHDYASETVLLRTALLLIVAAVFLMATSGVLTGGGQRAARSLPDTWSESSTAIKKTPGVDSVDLRWRADGSALPEVPDSIRLFGLGEQERLTTGRERNPSSGHPRETDVAR